MQEEMLALTFVFMSLVVGTIDTHLTMVPAADIVKSKLYQPIFSNSSVQTKMYCCTLNIVQQKQMGISISQNVLIRTFCDIDIP